ncbi:MAG: hypothetical protein A4E70_01900 [Syntrophus sp. PtaU1.Bin005]|uniref:hypothetical protein n=2 Tax=Syntrophus TaxID=43773 RepID=UPI0009C567D1|nr:MAG: hypothetical protein A4E69_00577 [Syntrophus sp. PtaB.Bin138]OPY80131.1 MAG: hypothetical protein A4E70_01900 [Syntrophus sp. PtaU1.Bin005]
MLLKAISCSGCGHEGPRDMPGALREQFEKDLFSSRGHDPYTGMLLFRCPRCGVVVAVDPEEVLGGGPLQGHPPSLTSEAACVTGRSFPLPVLGGLFSGLTLFSLFVKLFQQGFFIP